MIYQLGPPKGGNQVGYLILITFITPAHLAVFSFEICLKNKHAVFREGPYEEPNGDWKFNLKGLAAGNVIELTVALKNHYDDPKAALITVWFD